MSGPDRIIADCGYVPRENDVACFTVWGTLHEYIRRDPAVIATLPEVQAMVDAAEGMALAQAFVEGYKAGERAEGAVADALIQHSRSTFTGPDGAKHERASLRGVIRLAKAAIRKREER